MREYVPFIWLFLIIVAIALGAWATVDQNKAGRVCAEHGYHDAAWTQDTGIWRWQGHWDCTIVVPFPEVEDD